MSVLSGSCQSSSINSMSVEISVLVSPLVCPSPQVLVEFRLIISLSSWKVFCHQIIVAWGCSQRINLMECGQTSQEEIQDS